MKAYEEHMRNCPKCGHYGIRGPSYVAPTFNLIEFVGRMRWTCDTCGFEEFTACKDALRKEPKP